MSNDLDNIIFQNVKKGDQNAFRELFHKYYQPLYIFARKFVNDELAKDFIQDCFYKIWNNRNKIEITTSLSAYLFTIIKNRCYKHLKSEQKRLINDSFFGFKLKQEELNFFINSEKSILEFDVKDRIEKTIENLPERCGAVFKESRFQCLSNKEIAEKYNISVKAVEKQISKALRIFREEFKDFLTLLMLLILQYL